MVSTVTFPRDSDGCTPGMRAAATLAWIGGRDSRTNKPTLDDGSVFRGDVGKKEIRECVDLLAESDSD